jgi:hypothetical protein
MGKNVGGYDKEEKAARAYDLAALKYWGPTTTTNFPVRHQLSFDIISSHCNSRVQTHAWCIYITCWRLLPKRAHTYLNNPR